MGTVLEVRDIIRNYSKKGDGARPSEDDIKVIRGLSLKVEKKDFLGMMGKSGCGKSTLLRVLGLLDRPTEGKVFFEDFDTEELWKDELADIRRRKIGFVFQNFNLLPRQSALDNVALPLQYAKVPIKKRKQKAKEMLEMVDLADRVSFKPTQLSGGQKQRVAIARAMVADPKILLADEPTGALDSKSGLQVMELFDTLHKQGVTIIMITHSDEIASYADRVVKIIDGELYEGDAQPVTGGDEHE